MPAIINDTAYAQPATFAIEIALATLWRSFGIEPVAVMGHSLGEYAAAQVAGVMTLAEGLRLVAERGKLTRELASAGAMAAVVAPYSYVAAEIARSEGTLEIAAYNGPEHFVISGTKVALELALVRLESAGAKVKPLRISYAAHSMGVEPILPAFRGILDSVSFKSPRVTFVSNVSASPAKIEDIGQSGYWQTQMRRPVRFADSIQTLAVQGITHFIEIGPHPVLLAMGSECIPGARVEWLPSLRRDRAEWSDLLESLQRLYVSGADVDWIGFDRGYRRHRLQLPTYPFRRRRHWVDIVREPSAVATPWVAMLNALSRQSRQAPIDLNAASYPAKWDCLARLTKAHAIKILRGSNLFLKAGEKHTLTDVLDLAGIKKAYRHLIKRWLESLVTAGLLHRDGEIYSVASSLPQPELSVLWREAEELFADNKQLLAYVRHCGDLLGDILCGKESPIETLFPGGSFHLAEDLYGHSATMRYINALAGAAVEAVGRFTPPHRKLRIAEIGAGTGGTTATLLPMLIPERTSYSFTDVSEIFLDHARERFAAYPFVTFGRLDLDRDLAEQDYSPAAFDMVVSANALHASTDLRKSLFRLHELLAPGGVLILIETTTHLAWFDMTTGLIEGWQHFSDNLRNDNPLLSADSWITALSDAGFEAASTWPPSGSLADQLGQHVVVARKPGVFLGFANADADAHDVAPRVAVKSESDAFRQRARDALPSERIELMRDFVREKVMGILRLEPSEAPGRNDRLMDLGFDSLMAVQLRNVLGTGLALDRPLPATLMFDHPTIESLSSYLVALLNPTEVENVVAPLKPEQVSAVADMTDAEIEALLLNKLGSA